jgi:hypothetical protein
MNINRCKSLHFFDLLFMSFFYRVWVWGRILMAEQMKLEKKLHGKMELEPYGAFLNIIFAEQNDTGKNNFTLKGRYTMKKTLMLTSGRDYQFSRRYHLP